MEEKNKEESARKAAEAEARRKAEEAAARAKEEADRIAALRANAELIQLNEHKKNDGKK